jgi:CheY-like chemotaxis protein
MSCIIIAEDDQMVQRILVKMIKRSNYAGEVKAGNDANEALKLCQESVDEGIDLILVDTGLYPQGDQAFFDAIRLITANTPIVVSSGYGEDIIRTTNYFGAKPISAVLSKPFGMAEVKELLERFQLC